MYKTKLRGKNLITTVYTVPGSTIQLRVEDEIAWQCKNSSSQVLAQFGSSKQSPVMFTCPALLSSGEPPVFHAMRSTVHAHPPEEGWGWWAYDLDWSELFFLGYGSWFKDEHVTHSGQSKSSPWIPGPRVSFFPWNHKLWTFFVASRKKLFAMDKNNAHMKGGAELSEGDIELWYH